jgi:alpha-1,3-rhamnosyl/mannosyltransferase
LPPLVLVGPGSGWAQGGSIVGPQILSTGYLKTREVRALMAASSLLVLPSLEEGFGLPVAEAMAAGLPVVCSRGSALEEIAGRAATLVDPLNTKSIADGIERVLDDPTLAKEQRRKGIEESRKFDWEVTAAKTLEFYREVMGR